MFWKLFCWNSWILKRIITSINRNINFRTLFIKKYSHSKVSHHDWRFCFQKYQRSSNFSWFWSFFYFNLRFFEQSHKHCHISLLRFVFSPHYS
jgi:hypothetical protein